MPLFASLMVGLFGSLAGLLAKVFTEKVAFGVAAVATFATLTTAMIAVSAAAITGLVNSFPLGTGNAISIALYITAADSLNVALAAAFAADTAIFLYRWNLTNLKLVVGA